MYGGFDTIKVTRPRTCTGRAVEPTARGDAHARRAVPRDVRRSPQRARRRSTSVAHTSTAGSSASSASAIAPDPVPRSTAVAAISASNVGRRSVRRNPMPFGFLERGLDDPLGLRPRDQHPAIDHQIESTERPHAEHVLERLTLQPARTHVEQPDLGPRRRLEVEDLPPLRRVVTRRFLDHEACFRRRVFDAARGECGRDLAAKRAPRRRHRVRTRPVAAHARRPRARRRSRRAHRRARGRARAV